MTITTSNGRRDTVSPMRITVANLKGGAGKTTASVLLAEYLARSPGSPGCLLIDADIAGSGSSTEWAEDAGEAGTPLVATVIGMGRDINRQLPALEAGRHVVIDTPPGNMAIVTAAINAADVVVVPARPTPADFKRLWHTFELAEDLGTPAVVLLSQTRAGTKSTQSAPEALDGVDYPRLAQTLPLREEIAAAFGTNTDSILTYIAPIASELTAAVESLGAAS